MNETKWSLAARIGAVLFVLLNFIGCVRTAYVLGFYINRSLALIAAITVTALIAATLYKCGLIARRNWGIGSNFDFRKNLLALLKFGVPASIVAALIAAIVVIPIPKDSSADIKRKFEARTHQPLSSSVMHEATRESVPLPRNLELSRPKLRATEKRVTEAIPPEDVCALGEVFTAEELHECIVENRGNKKQIGGP